jgi:hypothetical protein
VADASTYPVTLEFDAAEEVARWRPFVHWLLAIPHYLVLLAIQIVAVIVAIIAWFAILFTGRLSYSFAGLMTMAVRYQTRITMYVYFLREEYPKFDIDATPADPGTDARLRVSADAALEGRNRLTTAFRFILVIPHWIVLWVLGYAVGVVVFIAAFAVLFTRRWPAGLRDFVVRYERWYVRVGGYAFFLTDEYPPFSLDDGGGTATAAPPQPIAPPSAPTAPPPPTTPPSAVPPTA